MKELNVKIITVEDGKLPIYTREKDACLDCYARVSELGVEIPAHSRCLVNLGFAIALPEDYEAVIRPRSGNTKNGIDIGTGTIDSNYRGELKACVINNSDGPFRIETGDRICQLAIREVPHINWIKVDKLEETERGANGFGSSGVK